MKVYVPSFLKINSLLFRHDLVSVDIHGTSKQSAFGGSGHPWACSCIIPLSASGVIWVFLLHCLSSCCLFLISSFVVELVPI